MKKIFEKVEKFTDAVFPVAVISSILIFGTNNMQHVKNDINSQTNYGVQWTAKHPSDGEPKKTLVPPMEDPHHPFLF